jgi:hypothetical protein
MSLPAFVMPDVATDSLGNFYLLYTQMQIIIAFTPSGIPIDTFTVTGSVPFSTTATGFALLGSNFYYESGTELHLGTVSGDTVNFSSLLTHPTITITDLAVCPTSGYPVTGFKDPEAPHFVIYPNPADDVAEIRMHNIDFLLVYDQLGVLHQNIPVKGLSEYSLNVENLKSGMYFLTAVAKNKATVTSKLLVR